MTQESVHQVGPDDREPTRTCNRCGVRHVPADDPIVIHDPDDEATACGFIHLERMSGKHIWLAVYTQDDGPVLSVHLHSQQRIDMEMEVDG